MRYGPAPRNEEYADLSKEIYDYLRSDNVISDNVIADMFSKDLSNDLKLRLTWLAGAFQQKQWSTSHVETVDRKLVRDGKAVLAFCRRLEEPGVLPKEETIREFIKTVSKLTGRLDGSAEFSQEKDEFKGYVYDGYGSEHTGYWSETEGFVYQGYGTEGYEPFEPPHLKRQRERERESSPGSNPRFGPRSWP